MENVLYFLNVINIQRSHFFLVNRKVVFTKIAGSRVLSLACPVKTDIHSPGTLNFNMFSGGDGLLPDWLRTWRTEKIPYAKLT